MGLNILIEINNMFGSTQIQLDERQRKMWLNGKEMGTDVDKFISKLLAITASWEEEYYRDMLDAEEFNLYISDGNHTQKVHCRGDYPNNYNELKSLILEVQNGQDNN